MGLSDQQHDVLDALGKSVNVSAGAGTGKTLTLTECIARSIEATIKEGKIHDPIGTVLAITFTNAAAEELKARVRSALIDRAEEARGEIGRKLKECAVQIDNAWISTIHGMASRILRENALAFNLDPTFEVLSETESDAILSQAIENVADRYDHSPQSPLARELLDVIPLHEAGSFQESLVSLLKNLYRRVDFMPRGCSGVVVPDASRSHKIALSSLYRAASSLMSALAQDASGGPNSALSAFALELGAAIASADRRRDAIERICGTDIRDAGLDVSELLHLALAYPVPSKEMASAKSELGSDFADYACAYSQSLKDIESAIGYRTACAFLQFAEDVRKESDKLKRDAGTNLDNNDLLSRCNEELSKPENGDILNGYRAQFDLIFLDEFQDTDKLQMAIISKLSRASGPSSGDGEIRLANVCTVGDMQQSIYRFRGGDVEETLTRIDGLERLGGLQLPLSVNYRSHEDILEAVRLVFSQPDVFGDGFLDLEPGRKSQDGKSEEIFQGRPRIVFEFLHPTRKSRKAEGVKSEEAMVLSAMNIASHFKELARGGVAPKDMAVLLGRMGNSAVFSKALRDAGLDSMIVGGSVFSQTEEAQLASSLLKYAVNQNDSEALMNILLSPLFPISDDVLLGLVRLPLEGKVKNRQLAEAFLSGDEVEGLDDDDARALSVARRVLSDFAIRAKEGAAHALRRVLSDSGYLSRLQAADTAYAKAKAGNLAKAIRIVSSIEAGSLGVAGVSSQYASHLLMVKESPGTLAESDRGYVSIMTVHMSKGLEFDHVAVADIRSGATRRSSMVAENIGDSTYMAFKMHPNYYPDGDLRKSAESVKKLADGICPRDDGKSYDLGDLRHAVCHGGSPEVRSAALRDLESIQELQEARRLLYVAMTRARESLYVSSVAAGSSKEYKLVNGDIFNAACSHLGNPENIFDEDFCAVQAPIMFKRKVLRAESMGEDLLARIRAYAKDSSHSESDDTLPFEVPIYIDLPDAELSPFDLARDDLCSYTSLSSGHIQVEGEGEGGSIVRCRAEGMAESASSIELPAASDAATDLGNAFHRLAEQSIRNARREDATVLSKPKEGAILAQARRWSLSDGQEARLRQALSAWFDSALCRKFSSFGSMRAEVPFSVRVESPEGDFFLEGEIDGLAENGEGDALLIDYKTGKTAFPDKDAEDIMDLLRKKHEMQSCCYAYALLAGGANSVHANFIRLEEADPESGDMPLVVEYLYRRDDIEDLRRKIAEARDILSR